MKKVKLNLVGLNGNAYNLLGAFAHAAGKQGWTKEEIDAVDKEATSGNYSHLLKTLAKNTEAVEEGDEEND